MRLLERESVLAELAGLRDLAATGRGTLVLVGGEAGIGKTALARRFCDQFAPGLVLIGRCDPVGTPRPLGPLAEIAPQAGGALAELARARAGQDQMFAAALEVLQDPSRTTLVVIEDVQWADESTLELLVFLGRRIESARGLMLVTFRSDELGPDHPLRVALGALAAAPGVRRLTLDPLSAAAVAALAEGVAVDADALHRVSGGNPFFVTEALAAGDGAVPESVRDAVLARAVRLPAQARAALEEAAVIGAAVPASASASGMLDWAGLDACVRAGILVSDGPVLRFRHEITHSVIYQAVPPGRRRDLHARALAALRAGPADDTDPAMAAHHAEAAWDRDAVLAFAPAAAERAARLGAHREAVAQYERALRFARDDQLRAKLLEGLAAELQLIGRVTDAVSATRTALAIREHGSDPRALGRAQRQLAGLLWSGAEMAQAKPLARAAVETLAQLKPDGELAEAYATLASLHMQAAETAEAERWATAARQLAEQLGDVQGLVRALRVLGSARLCGPAGDGWPHLEHALRLALKDETPALAASCYQGLVWFAAMHRQFGYSERYFSEGRAFCEAHELRLARTGMDAARCVELTHRGNWAEAADLAVTLLADTPSPVDRIQPLYVLGRLRARRGDPDAWEPLDEALALASPRSELQHIGNVRAVRAEAAWLAGNRDRMVAEAAAAYELALGPQDPWILGELALWLWRGGRLGEVPDAVAPHPYGLQISGQWAAAAAAWQKLGCPFEMAAAMLDADEEAPLRHAFQVFDGLGARPAKAMAAQRLRTLGISVPPRSQHPATRANRFRLTVRQQEVLTLIADGLTDAQIAGRLFLTTRTVNHHVGAILAKLGVSSRAEAARTWRQPR